MRHPSPGLPRLSERQVNPMRSEERVITTSQRRDPVKSQAIGPSPHDDIAMTERHPSLFVAALQATEQENGWQAKRDGYDRLGEVLLVAILMERKLGTGIVSIDETSIRHEIGKSRFTGCIVRQLRKGGR